MATEIFLPGLGESVAEGTIVRWLKAEGESVDRDEELVLVSTDKIETEVLSSDAGILLKILAPVGETVEVGATIALLGEAGEDVSDYEFQAAPKPRAPVPGASPSAPSAPSSPARQSASGSLGSPPASAALGFKVPDLSSPVPQGVLHDPASRNQRARAAGDPKLFVSPAVRRFAREHDVDLSLVEGTGQFGRITRGDIEAFAGGGGAGTGFASPPGGYAPGLRIPLGGFARRMVVPFDPEIVARFAPEQFPGDTLEPLSPLGRAMAEHMAYTWWRAPHVSTLVEVDMHRLAQARHEARESFQAETGAKLSYTACIGHTVARALSRHPGFNSSLTDDGRRIIHKRVNLGIAVARPDGGLVVPVIHGAEELSLAELAQALQAKIDKARDRKLVAGDLSGGTFTITNVGSNGNLASTPLINQPQVGILAVGVVRKRVVVVSGAQGKDEMAIRPMMFMTLTYDHRANDGSASGRFLRDLRKGLEQWKV